eukprot:534525-Pyramimonas_sp.AAC.1
MSNSFASTTPAARRRAIRDLVLPRDQALFEHRAEHAAIFLGFAEGGEEPWRDTRNLVVRH